VIARSWVVPLLAVALLGCPPQKGPTKTGADVQASDLPTAVADLNHYIDEQHHAQTATAMENALVAADKALGIEKNYETLWRAARACAWLTDEGRGGFAERGIRYARDAVALDAKRVEGQYWQGVNVGQLAQLKSSTKLVPEVVASAKLAAQADEKYDWAGPLRLLGATFARAPAPPTSVGDLEEGLKILHRAVELAPKHPLNRLFYCDALLRNKDFDAAERECQMVVQAQPAPDWAHRLPDWQKDAEKKIRAAQRLRHSNAGPSGIP
jgi:Tetratricopeptide repeat